MIKVMATNIKKDMATKRCFKSMLGNIKTKRNPQVVPGGNASHLGLLSFQVHFCRADTL
jgi:hypothetical protein